MAGYDITKSTDYGGKAAPSWASNGFELPGYHNAFLSISKKSTGEEILALPFKISPSSFSEARSKLYQLVKTMGGWMVQKLGSNPIEVNLSGYMLDIKGTLERHDFLDSYERYIDDRKNYTSDYYNEYHTKLVVEGREYYGIVAGLNFQKSAANPFIYSYNLSFVALGQKRIYNADYAVLDARILAGEATNAFISTNMYISPTIGNLLNASSIQSNGVGDKLSSPVNTEEQSIFAYANMSNSQKLTQTEKSNKAEIAISETTLKNPDVFTTSNNVLGNTNKLPEDSIKFVINRLPQEVYQDAYGIKWNIAQVMKIDKEYGFLNPNYSSTLPYEYTYEHMIEDRKIYLNIINNMSADLSKKLNQQVYLYLTSNNNAGNDIYQNFKVTVISILDSIVELSDEEMGDPIPNSASSSYRMERMNSQIEQFFNYITKK